MTSYSERIRSALMATVLTLLYFILVTPLALRRRGSSDIITAKSERVGWHRNEQSTSNLKTYAQASSIDIGAHSQNDRWLTFLTKLLLSLRWLAEESEERELSSDLYVMF